MKMYFYLFLSAIVRLSKIYLLLSKIAKKNGPTTNIGLARGKILSV